MMGRLAELRGRVSSHWLASAIALAYLLASVLLGAALLANPKTADSEAAPAASTPTHEFSSSLPAPSPTRTDDSGSHGGATTTTTTRPHTTTVVPPPAPAGYQRVTGPAGIRTVVPTGWHIARSTGPGSMQATDPSNATRFVKFGGTVASPLGIEPLHIQYENDFAVRETSYLRLVLQSASYGGHDAVQWEFEHRDGAVVSHVCSLYWRANGKEYFILASAPVDVWDAMKPVYDTMEANADP
jgi:hypothetical protein